MPTAARLVAALCFAALGFVASETIKTVMPASTVFGVFSIVNAVLGLIIGWMVLGGRAGRGYAAAISNGFTAVIVLVFWGLLIQGANEMARLAQRRVYDDMFEAVIGIFQNMADFAMILVDVRIILTLLIGGLVSALFAEAASRRWR